ncbi:pectin lyase fold/virulence factor [Paraphoma chrysanthemicola]|uniref:pectinesterase n=1 Tax=Paraphoma chrysanthemicola TaxID=798071 RepID=A0A8K0R4E2_9PLEO|nr:pectin lyase fold/virulence factor [Paraphoma chrysanthemicola]
MRLLIVAALLGLAVAQVDSVNATISSVAPTSSSTLPVVSSATSSGPISAITVAKDGSGQFTAINPAILAAQNGGIASVTILPGTYSEVVTVTGTATVTIVGATASPVADWSQNQVTIAAPSAALTIGSSNSKGVSLRNLNFINTNATSVSAATVVVALRGSNIAFYGCSIISTGITPISAGYGLGFFANSYIEGADKLFYNFPTIYVYGSTMVPLTNGGSVVFSKGATVGGTFSNSTVVIDSSTIQQKSGTTTSGVFLAAPNGAGAVAIFRNTVLGGLIAPAGVHPQAGVVSSFYGEFLTTGAGSYGKNTATRKFSVPLTGDQVSQYTIDRVYGNAFSPYGSTSLGWIDQDVLSALQSSDAAQLASAASVVSSAVPSDVSSIASSSVSSTSMSMTNSSNSISSTLSASATSSTIAASSCSVVAPSGTLVVSKTPGPCEYSSVTSAISALPNDSKPYTIQIGAGTYVEQISITRKGKVTLVGATEFTNDYTKNKVRIEFSSGRLTNLGQNEQTPVIYSKKTSDNSGLAVYNIDFVNTYPQTYNTAALAADFYGANMAAYGCSFIGFQDTLLANKGTQVFSNCYIEGSVDFVWGFSTAYFYQCMLVSNTPGSTIAAQSRATADTVGGYVFDSCMVTYSASYGSTYGSSFLGRPYSQFSIAVFMNSYIDKHIKDAGWSVWSTSNPQTSGVMFGEYNNIGPGSWQASTQRASFATSLTPAQASKYELAAWIGDISWLDMAAYNAMPSYSLTGPVSTTPSANTTMPAPQTTATINAHPDSGSTPPFGSVIVSTDGTHNASFSSLTAALASLPNDSTNQTIFMYSGSYNEQVPAVNRPGAVRIIGFTSGKPGQSYKDNTVTITYSRGLSISPLPAGHSNAETATFSTASNRISLYNINMINTDNLDGATPNYVTLAGSIYGKDIGFYGCSFDGWQDTLLTGVRDGYQYYESCYIGGAIDFIWGYSKAYFKGCTLGAKRASSAITAHSRSSSTAIGGYIFDQCLFTAAPNAAVDLTNKVYLGRPYSQYALVVVKNSYIDSTIIPVGWKIWSATDPRTDYITFAEYNNVGPSNWENNVAARQSFGNATLLTSDTYPLSAVMASTDWIDMTFWNSIVTPQPAVIVPPSPTNITVNGTSVFNGTAPPTGALIVSKSPISGVTTFDTIQAALDAAPTSSKTNATIFIYPGVYTEQLILNKSGHTIFQGFSSATDDYSKNQVTIQFSRGSDTQATTGSNTDGATVYAKGNYFHAFNINFRNNNGTQQDIASLGFAVQSSKFAALYGCQIYGNQDTLSVSGNLFTFKTYIEGNVDFIYGTGSAYFLDSTIAPNEDGISITASKRATNTTSAGFVFDQCTLKPAPGTGPFTNVGLGRPWNSFSRVAYVNCYFDSMISAVGWNPWSKSSPQTSGVQYGEYHNYGPGAGVCGRASFSQQLSDTDVVQYQLGNFFGSTSFIDFRHVDTQPFTVGIGSAQTCSSASSSVRSSTASATSSRTSIASSLPLVTAYTTKTETAKLTASTLYIQPDVTSTTFVKLTLTTTISEADVTRTTTQKTTFTTSITSPDVVSTSTYVVTQDNGRTISPAAATTTSVVKATSTQFGVTTRAGSTRTIEGTTTLTLLSTSSPRAVTLTQSEGSTMFITSSITPKGSSTTIRTTISLAPSSTKTSTVKAKSSISVTSTSSRITTKKSTVTATCIPTDSAQRMVRRGAIIPRAVASTTTLTISTTLTSYVKTITATQPGSTAYVTQTSVGATKTTTLDGSTTTVTITSIAATRTAAQAGATIYTTITSTSQIGKTTTLKQSTSTVYSTSYATREVLSTVTAAAVTVSSFKTRTTTQTIVANQQTVYVTRSADVTSTIRTTLPVSTSTEYETVTLGGGIATQTVTAAPSTKTVVLKVTSTVVQFTTKTSKGAAQCTN